MHCFLLHRFFFFSCVSTIVQWSCWSCSRCTFAFCASSEITKLCLRIIFFFLPFSTADCSELQFCAAFMCVLILMCHRGESTNLQPLSWRCKIFESVLFDHIQSVLSLSFNGTGTLFKFSSAKIRADSKTYGIPTTCIAASTTCATNERGFVWRMPLHSIFIEFGLPKKKHFSSHAYLPVPNRMIND